MGRFARSWDLTKTSFAVVRQDKELLWMPVLSGLASLVTVLAVAGVGFASGLWPETQNADGTANVPGFLLAFVLYVLLAFVGLFFNAAVVAAANQRLGGGDPTVGSALRAAAGKAGRLFAWSIVVATVNLVLQAIRERSGILGRILASIGGLAWNLATFFMVPILLFEQQPLGPSVKRSASLFRQTWGETVIGQGGLGLVATLAGFLAFLVGILAIVVLSALGAVGFGVGVAILVIALLGVTAFFSVLQGVYKAALYRYATSGQATGGFQPQQLGAAFAPK